MVEECRVMALEPFVRARAVPLQPHSSFLLRARVLALVEVFLEKVERRLNEVTGGEFSLAICREASLAPDVVTVELRVFQEPALLHLPRDIVQEISVLLAPGPATYLLAPPRREEATAFAYLIASALADRELFPAQSVYLANVGGERSPVCEATFFVSCHCNRKRHVLGVTLSSGLRQRIEHYARLARPGSDQLRRLALLQTTWKVALQLSLRSLQLLCAARARLRIGGCKERTQAKLECGSVSGPTLSVRAVVECTAGARRIEIC